MHRRRWIQAYGWGLAVYAAAIALYLWMARGNAVPSELLGTAADPRTFMSDQQIRDSETYWMWRNWLFFVGPPWEWGVYLVVLFSGAAARCYERLRRRIKAGGLRLSIYIVSLAFVVFAAGLPWRIAGYALSRSYGITTQPLLGWFRDKLVAFGIGTLTMAAALGAVLWLMRRGGRWWLKLWVLSIPFTLSVMVVQPVVIDPLYETFSRLSDPSLERDILKLAAAAGVPADRVYEVHMSDKTMAMNAYVNGIGPTLRIVLWDTTLQQLNREEIMHIMAHEIGHYAMHHLEWSAIGAIGSSLGFIWIGSLLLRRIMAKWGECWGVERTEGWARQHPSVTATVVLLLVSVLTFAVLPLSNAVSRRAEYAADQFALHLLGNGKGAVTMNQKLAAATLDIVNPPLLVYWFRSSHPKDMERIYDAATYRP